MVFRLHIRHKKQITKLVIEEGVTSIGDYFLYGVRYNISLDELMMIGESLSHSDIKTIVFSAIRNMILSGREELTNCDVLKEIYFQ